MNSFSRLPRELRDEIYGLCLFNQLIVTNEDGWLFFLTYKPQVPVRDRQLESAPGNSLRNQLWWMATCKQTFHEAREEFYRIAVCQKIRRRTIPQQPIDEYIDSHSVYNNPTPRLPIDVSINPPIYCTVSDSFTISRIQFLHLEKPATKFFISTVGPNPVEDKFFLKKSPNHQDAELVTVLGCHQVAALKDVTFLIQHDRLRHVPHEGEMPEDCDAIVRKMMGSVKSLTRVEFIIKEPHILARISRNVDRLVTGFTQTMRACQYALGNLGKEVVGGEGWRIRNWLDKGERAGYETTNWHLEVKRAKAGTKEGGVLPDLTGLRSFHRSSPRFLRFMLREEIGEDGTAETIEDWDQYDTLRKYKSVPSVRLHQKTSNSVSTTTSSMIEYDASLPSP